MLVIVFVVILLDLMAEGSCIQCHYQRTVCIIVRYNQDPLASVSTSPKQSEFRPMSSPSQKTREGLGLGFKESRRCYHCS
ncbi:hypothetical protein CPB84DRAFT_1198023 [Gymnopilus junonius]|uniref:Secreted protein n=1 Tax=Gymnopilus junonius TaxID=109634 RepID=A0A9P5NJ55_GYMJU|nr:hypothetical protein CPB84DRAFT_1198023 [Gymnopilus junonius]